MRRSRQALKRFREERREAVRQFVGNHWSEEGTKEKVPLNLLALYVQIVGRALVAKNPRVMLSTFDRALKPTVSAMQAWANREIERMKLADTLQRVVIDSLFSVGVCKVALATPADAGNVGWGLAAGQPFAERVDLDDFVFDVHARDFHSCSFIGHRYRVPLELVKESKLYSKARKDLAASSDPDYNVEGDERIKNLGQGDFGAGEEEFEDMVDLWEVYLPRHRVVLTLADDQLTGPSEGRRLEPLREQPWVGPYCGPYHVLAMNVVPGSAMPKAPIQDLIDLHEAANRAYRKMIRMCERTKENTFVAGGALEDGSRIQKADDGEIIRVDRPEAIKQVVSGGTAIQQVLAVATVLKDLFSFMGGNLELLGGRGPQSKTATQDTMLNQSAQAGLADMQARAIDFVAETVKSLCWYWWHDPYNVQRATHSPPGMPGMSYERRVTPEMRRRGKFEDLGVQVDPYSMQYQTPQSRLQFISQLVQQTVIPMMPLMVQQGVAFDINAYLKKIGEYADQPDLPDILTIQEPPEGAAGGGHPAEGRMPQSTERRYVRENMPGRTTQATDQDLVARMLGHDLGGDPNKEASGAPQPA